MGAPVDPLYTQYVVQKVVLGHGADGGVVRGVDKETDQWHALKFLSRDAYAPQREVDTWRMLKHPNIVSLLRVFALAGTRPHWVLAMPEADFTLHEYIRRSLGQARATEDVVRDLAGQLLAGIACVHEHGLVHRDIKPTNIMLSVVPPATSQGGMRLMLGDFSRARQAPPRRRLRTSTKTSKPPSLPTECPMSTRVCTPAYCAPEALFPEDAGSHLLDHDGVATYGQAVDIWSFGAVVFEMLEFECFAPGHTSMECLLALICRLGPLPFPIGPLPMGHTAGDSRLGVQPLRDCQLCAWASELLRRVLCWVGADRATALDLLSHWHSDGGSIETRLGGLTVPHRRVEAEASCQQGKRARLHPGDLLATQDTSLPVTTTSDEMCACSGHCYTPKHRWQGGCSSKTLLAGSSYCPSCGCDVKGCGRPRLRGPLCSFHKKLWDSCPAELRLTRAMRHGAVHFIPCDIVDFSSRFADYMDDLAAILVIALLKEPSAIATWVSTGVPGSLSGRRSTEEAGKLAEALVKSLATVVRSAHTSPATREMQQLHRQGVARFMGAATTCSSLGVIEKVRPGCTAGSDAEVVRLGLTEQEYRIVNDTSMAKRFLQACHGHAATWRSVVQETDMHVVVAKLHDIVRGVAQNSGGTAYGSGRSFTTGACSTSKPTVATSSASSIGQTRPQSHEASGEHRQNDGECLEGPPR